MKELWDMTIRWIGGSSPSQFILVSGLKCSLVLAASLLILAIRSNLAPIKRNLIARLAIVSTLLIPILSLILIKSAQDVFNPLAISITTAIISSNGAAGGPASSSSSAGIFGIHWLSLPLAVYLLGIFAGLFYFLLGVFLTNRMIKQAQPTKDNKIISLLANLADAVGTRRPVAIIISSCVRTPFVFGITRPSIILPESFQRWDIETMKMVLTHELAHLRRRDLLWTYLGSLAVAVHWFNPLVWIVRKEMVNSAERICDDFVLIEVAEGTKYAEKLVSLARDIEMSGLVPNYGAGMIRKSNLEERIMSILRKGKRTVELKRSIVAVISVAAIIILLPLAIMQLRCKDSSEPANLGPAKGIQPTVAITDKSEASGNNLDSLPSPDEWIKTDSPAVMIEEATPIYPDSAKNAHLQGTVWVQALIDKTGKVRNVQIRKSSGIKMFEDAAMDAARKCKWLPAMQNNQPVPVWVSYMVEFTLSESVNK